MIFSSVNGNSRFSTLCPLFFLFFLLVIKSLEMLSNGYIWAICSCMMSIIRPILSDDIVILLGKLITYSVNFQLLVHLMSIDYSVPSVPVILAVSFGIYNVLPLITIVSLADGAAPCLALPQNSRCRLIPLIANCHPVCDIICWRFIHFVLSRLNGDLHLISSVVCYGVFSAGMYSVIG
jgi:hypothetical protein